MCLCCVWGTDILNKKINKGYNMTRQQKKELQKYQNCLPYVEVKDNAIDKALSQFKRKVKNSGLLKELRDREYYEKPSIRKRNKRKKRQLRAKYSD